MNNDRDSLTILYPGIGQKSPKNKSRFFELGDFFGRAAWKVVGMLRVRLVRSYNIERRCFGSPLRTFRGCSASVPNSHGNCWHYLRRNTTALNNGTGGDATLRVRSCGKSLLRTYVVILLTKKRLRFAGSQATNSLLHQGEKTGDSGTVTSGTTALCLPFFRRRVGANVDFERRPRIWALFDKTFVRRGVLRTSIFEGRRAPGTWPGLSRLSCITSLFAPCSASRLGG